jgi:ribosomal protein S27E
MKIIKPGIEPAERVFQVTCRDCECEFAFKRKEANMTTDRRDGDFLSINCPTCFRTVTVFL